MTYDKESFTKGLLAGLRLGRPSGEVQTTSVQEQGDEQEEQDSEEGQL